MEELQMKSYVAHPKFPGVFMKHFFTSKDNDFLNNLEVIIKPDCEIGLHTHEVYEFFYVARGKGMSFGNNEWNPAEAGDAFSAKPGEMHGFKNTSEDDLVLFSTFAPAII